MKWKYIYYVLRQRSALSRYCGEKGNAVADECDLAIEVLKKASRQKSKESQITSHNKTKVQIVALVSDLEDRVANGLDCSHLVTNLKYHAQKL